jgi:hypothetical protein
MLIQGVKLYRGFPFSKVSLYKMIPNTNVIIPNQYSNGKWQIEHGNWIVKAHHQSFKATKIFEMLAKNISILSIDQSLGQSHKTFLV